MSLRINKTRVPRLNWFENTTVSVIPIFFFLTLILSPSWPSFSPPCSCTASVYSLRFLSVWPMHCRQTLASYPISTSCCHGHVDRSFSRMYLFTKDALVLVPEASLRRVCLHPESAWSLRREHPRKDRAGALRGRRLRPHTQAQDWSHSPTQSDIYNKTDTDVAIANRLISCRVIFGWHLQKRQNLPIG